MVTKIAKKDEKERPHPARHALQSTTSDRSHAIGFYCRLTCGGSTFSIELGPSRNTSIHASETECSPRRLALRLAKRVTRPASMAVDLRLARLTLRSVDRTTIVTAKVHLAATTSRRAREEGRALCICGLWNEGCHRHSHNGQSKHQLSHSQSPPLSFSFFTNVSLDTSKR
jgi:hypothetical protein